MNTIVSAISKWNEGVRRKHHRENSTVRFLTLFLKKSQLQLLQSIQTLPKFPKILNNKINATREISQNKIHTKCVLARNDA